MRIAITVGPSAERRVDRFKTRCLSLIQKAKIEDTGLVVATQASHLPACKARFALASSFNLRSSAFGYLRSRESSAAMTAAATTTRANHLLSAGTTYHGAAFVAVFRIMSSYASM